MQKTDNPYLLLDVPKDATEQQIKTAYHKLALKHHPDRQTTEEGKAMANAMFAKVCAAHTILVDPKLKRDFDLAHRDWDKRKKTSAGSAPTSPAATKSRATVTPPGSPPFTSKANPCGDTSAAGHEKEAHSRSPKKAAAVETPPGTSYSGGVSGNHKTEHFTRAKKEMPPPDTSYTTSAEENKREAFNMSPKKPSASPDTSYSGGVSGNHKTETFTRAKKDTTPLDTSYTTSAEENKREAFNMSPKKSSVTPDTSYSGGVSSNHKTEHFTRAKKDTTPLDTSYTTSADENKREAFNISPKKSSAPPDTSYSGGVSSSHKKEYVTRAKKEATPSPPLDTSYSGGVSSNHKTESFTRAKKETTPLDTSYTTSAEENRKEAFNMRSKRVDDACKPKKKAANPDTTYRFAKPSTTTRRNYDPEDWSD